MRRLSGHRELISIVRIAVVQHSMQTAETLDDICWSWRGLRIAQQSSERSHAVDDSTPSVSQLVVDHPWVVGCLGVPKHTTKPLAIKSRALGEIAKPCLLLAGRIERHDETPVQNRLVESWVLNGRLERLLDLTLLIVRQSLVESLYLKYVVPIGFRDCDIHATITLRRDPMPARRALFRSSIAITCSRVSPG